MALTTEHAPTETLPGPIERDRADGVFEGGGVKGIAFTGALAAVHEAGIREWVNVAGTSAGAIVAALLAAGHKAPDLRDILDEMPLASFADYGRGGRVLGGARNALLTLGLVPGRVFEEWLADRFEASPLGKREPTFGDLVRTDLPENLPEDQAAKARYRLRVIASDITAGRMLVLPDDVVDYEDEDGRPYTPDSFSVVKAVRMSMSFPYFFNPVRLRRRATEGHPAREHVIVDGGLLSNFPIWLFDGKQAPIKRWTFGFRLYCGAPPEALTYRKVGRPVWPWSMTKAMLFAATEGWDRRKLSEASALRTISIPTHDVATLKFDLDRETRDALYDWGHEAATQFLAEQHEYRNHAGVQAAGIAV